LKKSIAYLIFSLLLIGLAITIASCGGGSDVTGIVPGGVPETEQLIQKTVSGFIYNIPGQSVDRFIIIDCSISGEESFLNQMSSYLQNNYPDIWSSVEIQELFNQLTSEMAGWQILPQYNPDALLYAAYSDTPIPVGEDGYFEATVSVPAGAENIHLEVVAGEECFGVETVASSDFLTSGAAGQGRLKCSHKSITALPGGFCLFKVFSIPPTDLRGSLVFEFNDPSSGTMTPPFFLKIGGEMNYNLACGVFKANETVVKGKETKVSNGNGNNLYIPVDIVHETSSVSGKVHTGGESLLKGHVTSIGPKSSCHLDGEGNYVLPEVFQGSYRKVTATWWTEVAGKQVKHTEIKYIENLVGDVTNFDFGVVPVSTPRPPSDPYYDNIISKVISQKREWTEELGVEQGVQKTVDWLNDLAPEVPIPPEIAEVIVEAKVNEYDSKKMKLYFTNGMVWALEGYQGPLYFDTTNKSLQNKDLHDKTLDSIKFNAINSAEADTVKNSSVVILWPYMWQQFYGLTDPDVETTVYALGGILKENGYDDVKCVSMRTFSDPLHPDPNADIKFEFIEDPTWGGMSDELRCKISKPDNIIRPQDFEDLDHYGVIYIATHGYSDGIIACPAYFEDEKLNAWIDDYKNLGKNSLLPNWEYSTTEYLHILDPIGKGMHCTAIKLTENFFYQQDFSGSLVYINACESYKFHENAGFWDAKVYLGYNAPREDGTVASPWCDYLAYYYFYYLMYQFIDPMKVYPEGFSYTPPDPLPAPIPMSVRDAYEILKQVEATPDPHIYLDLPNANDAELLLDTGVYGLNDNIYFPVPVTVIVNKNNLK